MVSPDSQAETEASPDAAEREQLIAAAITEFIDLQSQDELANPDSFCRTRPELMPELREELETLAQMDRVFESASSSYIPPAIAEDSVPERLSGHRILSEIGAGGMGRVLLALDEKLNRKVAIKVLSARYRN
ncbi:MAG TPA: hypothetical protein VI756_13625, partial [Blastocatellia bacterium]